MGRVCEWLGLKVIAHQGEGGSGKSLSINEGKKGLADPEENNGDGLH